MQELNTATSTIHQHYLNPHWHRLYERRVNVAGFRRGYVLVQGADSGLRQATLNQQIQTLKSAPHTYSPV